MNWSMLWWSMLRELRLTGGIGVRTAASTPDTLTRDDPKDPITTSATSANTRKKSKNAERSQIAR